jgi:hypothetical protein
LAAHIAKLLSVLAVRITTPSASSLQVHLADGKPRMMTIPCSFQEAAKPLARAMKFREDYLKLILKAPKHGKNA